MKYTFSVKAPRRKCGAIWRQDGSVLEPIVYLVRPKWISEAEFRDFLERLVISVEEEE